MVTLSTSSTSWAEELSSAEYAGFSWTGALDKGTYLIGIRTKEGIRVCADNFRASAGAFDSKLQVTAPEDAEVISGLCRSTDVLVLPDTVNEIPMPRFLAATKPKADRTYNEPPVDEERSGGLSGPAKAALIGGAALLLGAAGVAAANLVRKKNERKSG